VFGIESSGDTSKVLALLSDAKIEYSFTDVGSKSSVTAELVSILANTDELPVLIKEGVCYVGLESIQGYSRS